MGGHTALLCRYSQCHLGEYRVVVVEVELAHLLIVSDVSAYAIKNLKVKTLATYPYAIKNQRKARNIPLGVFRPKAPSRGLWVP